MGSDLDQPNLAAVVIGRNEGERLFNCLTTVTRQFTRVVYVDSGSTDDSVEQAHEFGVEVVELDPDLPFTAARARNAGYQKLIEKKEPIGYLQFIDGDCELETDWLNIAIEFLDRHDEVAIVCGRRRERYPNKTLYNQLCDFEWDRPVGETQACGGDSLVRVAAFSAVTGFADRLVAGEEPELCLRLRRAGWKIWRLDQDMTLHDANMTRFHQWWKRSIRSGFTYAQGVSELGRDCVRERNRALFWGGVLPLLIGGLLFWRLDFLLIIAVYPLQAFRIAILSNHRFSVAIVYGGFITIAKFPEMLGIVKYYVNNLFGITHRLIEYK